MSYKVLTDGNGSGLINVVGLGHFMRLGDHNEVIKELQFAKQELIDLKAERDALAAQLVKIQDAALKPCGRTHQQWTNNIKRNALEITARQCLAETRAEAVQCAVNNIASIDMSDLSRDFTDGYEYCRALIIQYAEQILQGGTK